MISLVEPDTARLLEWMTLCQCHPPKALLAGHNAMAITSSSHGTVYPLLPCKANSFNSATDARCELQSIFTTNMPAHLCLVLLR